MHRVKINTNFSVMNWLDSFTDVLRRIQMVKISESEGVRGSNSACSVRRINEIVHVDLTAERVVWIQKISIQLWITNERSNSSDDDCHVIPSKQTELFQSQVVVCAD